jgi:muramoyltetrapeptide carboxypeptidase LdcA involved in peptidoglycan recycling
MKKNNLEKNTIYTVSLSSGLAGEKPFINRYNHGALQLKELGFNVKQASNSMKGIAYLKDNPKARVDDLIEAFDDPNTYIILSNIGGDDSYKLWKYLKDIEIKNTKPLFLGFSDSTSVHLMLYKKNIKSCYGMSNLTTFAENNGILDYSKKWFEDYFINNNKEIIVKSSEFWTSELLKWEDPSNYNISRKLTKEQHGIIYRNCTSNIEGELLGGCLESLFKVMNHEFFPKLSEWKDKVIFLETSEHKPAPEEFLEMINKMKPILLESKAIIFGKPQDEKYFHEYLEILSSLNIPLVYNLNFGHTDPVMVIGYGDKINIDFKNKEIKICPKR